MEELIQVTRQNQQRFVDKNEIDEVNKQLKNFVELEYFNDLSNMFKEYQTHFSVKDFEDIKNNIHFVMRDQSLCIRKGDVTQKLGVIYEDLKAKIEERVHIKDQKNTKIAIDERFSQMNNKMQMIVNEFKKDNKEIVKFTNFL